MRKNIYIHILAALFFLSTGLPVFAQEDTLPKQSVSKDSQTQQESQNNEVKTTNESQNTPASETQRKQAEEVVTESKPIENKEVMTEAEVVALEKEAGEKEEVQQEPIQEPVKEKIVKAIEIKGNKFISTNVVISKMKTKIGAAYQENIVSDDLKRLYLLGYFSDIKIDTEDFQDGLKIVVTVQERPIISKITFTGMLKLTTKDEKLKEMLKSKETQYLDYPNLAEDIQILKKLYEKIGFSNAQIDYTIDVDKETNRAKVQFNIVENKKVVIKNIIIAGNKSIPTRKILRVIKTKKGWIFNAGLLKEDVLIEDMERIKSFYGKEGFPDAQASYLISPFKKRANWLSITVNITEGKKFLIGSVMIKGNTDVPEKDILASLKESSPGKVFSQDAIKNDVTNIQGMYFDKGYISAVVQEATSVNEASGRVDVVYAITENEIAYVDKIKVRGNVKTKDIVIRREMRIMPGDKFDGEKLKRSKERLQNLGFFEEVSYDTEDTNVPNKKDLVVDVKESKTGSFSFGGGFSTVEQLVGFVEVEQKNFDWKNFPYFTGAGQNLKFRASFGSVSDGFELSFTEPWMFDYPIAFGFDGYKRTHKRDSDIGYGYDEDIIGGDLRLGKEISEYWRADVAYRCDQIQIGQVSDNATADLLKEVGRNVISSGQFSMSFDSRDNIFNPTKGNLLTGSLECAGGPFAGDKDFVKFYGRASHYVPLFRGSTVEFRGRLGLANAYDKSTDLPIYERFFAGGASTIRGYQERRIGPIDMVTKDPLGGNGMLLGNVEYLYPLFDFLKVAAFYDVGNVWKEVKNIGSLTKKDDNTGGLKSGVGLGIRMKTPIGPVMLDYGIPLNKEPGEEKKSSGRFHFSISNNF